MSRPWLSVITPVYNGENHLSSALDSIVIQGDDDIECIAVDGMSTDSTLNILKSYQGKLPLTILQRESSSNWVTKTNYGLDVARGEYVCFLHHDDLWYKQRLEIIRKLTRQYPKVILHLHSTNYLDSMGNIVGLWSCPLPVFPRIIKPALMTERLLVQNFISILGPVFKRDAALKIGGLDEALWYTADWDFWLKIAGCGETVYFPKPLSGFRIHPSSQTIKRSSHAKDFRNQLEVVANRYYSQWEAPEQLKRKVLKVAFFSIEVNITLASAIHGERTNIISIINSFLLLGPAGWYRYIRDSRIVERVTARLKAQLAKSAIDH